MSRREMAKMRSAALIEQANAVGSEEISRYVETMRKLFEDLPNNKQLLPAPQEKPSGGVSRRAALNTELEQTYMTPDDDTEFRKRARHFDQQHDNINTPTDKDYDKSIFCTNRPISNRSKEEDCLEMAKTTRQTFRKTNPDGDELGEFRHMTAMLLCELKILTNDLRSAMYGAPHDMPSRQIVTNMTVFIDTFLKNEKLIQE